MTLYIKESEIIVSFLKYQDTHCIIAHITMKVVGSTVERKQQSYFYV